jgi:hypothetical protein
VFCLNLGADDVETLRRDLRHADVVPLATADLEEDGRRLLGDEGKMFVLRPDGYLGFRGRMGFQPELMNYAAQDALV